MKDAVARRAVVSLLARGRITMAEAVMLSGVSRQLVHYWARSVDWRRVRGAVIAREWRKAINR